MMVMPSGDEFVHVYNITLDDDTGKLEDDRDVHRSPLTVLPLGSSGS
jgi:hypothetical protein